jgi:hypothetical protein
MENYYELERESFSSISKLADGPQAYLKAKEEVFEDKDYFVRGKLVDELRCLEDFNDIETFIQDNYFINTVEMPTAQSYELANYLSSNFDSIKEINDKVILESIKLLNLFGSTKKEELLLEKYKAVSEYVEFKLKTKNSDKKVLEWNDYIICKDIIQSFLNNSFTSEYMNNVSTEETEYINEMPILWEILLEGNKIELKSKLDKVIINHTNKTIQPIDFKTTGDNTTKFKKSYIQFRYFYQAAMYLGALSYKQYKEKWLTDYTILPFKFIVETTDFKSIGNPLVYEVPFQEATIATQNKAGYKIGYTPIKGWIELLEDLVWYRENGFEKDRTYIENGGKYELKIFE